MPTSDKTGRHYAKLNDLKPGDRVQVDDGFTCIPLWSEKEVRADQSGDLWIKCRRGQHYLDGQLDYNGDTDALVGIYKLEELAT